MGTIWVREFTGGLDARRLPETTPGGALVKALDGHINRGGEFEKRRAFVPTYDLPVDGDTSLTVGLAYSKTGIVSFGSGAPPTMPSGVTYQRLQHPDGETTLTRVLSFDLYAGKIYVVGEFADGSRYHFYDGVRVPDWFDGRARATFSVTAGGVNPAVSATGSFEVTGGTSNPTVNKISNITIDGVTIISGAVDHTGNNATTAAAVALAITSHTSSPNYSATSNGQLVTVTATATGTAVNGKAIIITAAGDATVGNVSNMEGGAAASTSELSDLTVDGVSIIGAPVQWTTSNSDTADAIAAAINSHTSSPDYEATSAGETVSIVAASAGVSANGRAVAFTVANGLAVAPASGLALANGTDAVEAAAASGSLTVTGGTNNAANQLTDLRINGVAIISGAVTHTGSNATTATAIASAINSYVSTPDYSAAAVGDVVTVTAASTGAAINGQSIVPTVTGNFTVGSLQAMSGGADSEATFVPGTFVKTIGSRMHCVSGANEHGSGLQQPTKWTTDTTGAFFIDMSTQASGAERLISLAKYQNFVAVLAERVIQIWRFESDPANNSQVQVLNNTGTASPRSVTQFGDADVFYLDESGLRSLRARDSSNAAATTDIGVPVDPLIIAKLRSLSAPEREQVIGLIEPSDGRFWLIMRDTIFVFSFFSGAKISAWSQYTPAYWDEEGERVEFEIDDAVVFQRRVYIRSGDTIFVYGGLETGAATDQTSAVAWLPYLDANTPSVPKKWQGVDAALRGVWTLYGGMQPTEEGFAVQDKLATLDGTTYNLDAIATLGTSTHVSLRFESSGDGEALLSSCAIHYEGDADGAA